MVGRPDVHVVVGEDDVVIWRGDGLGLRDLLRLEAVAVEHVPEVHVPADVELVGVVERGAAVLEEPGEHAVDDRRAHLALDVVADDRDAGVGEPLRPDRVRGDETGMAFTNATLASSAACGVVPLGVLGADGQVRDEHVRAGARSASATSTGSAGDSSTTSR